MKPAAVVVLSVAMITAAPAGAEILSSSDTHYVLRHEAVSTLPPSNLWRRLTKPATWWHPDHTYSGDSANLSLDVTAGGLWREDWTGGSVAHGRILFVQPGRLLRLEAPFGPLAELGAYTVWTITIESSDSGSKVVFDEVSTGPPAADMANVATAVDYVKGEAIARLAGRIGSN